MKLSECTKCPLHQSRTKVVGPRGDGSSGVLLLGEAPGAEEDASGFPFFGPAGQLLSEYITRGFNTELMENSLVITNVVKCRPPENRKPEREEMKTCGSWLNREFEHYRPWLVVALGLTAATRMFPGREWSPFTPHVGKVSWHRKYECLVLVTFHPSYVMRKHDEATQKLYERHFRWIESMTNGAHWHTEHFKRVVMDAGLGVEVPITPEDE